MTVYERHTLSNGLRVLTAPLEHAKSVACYVMLAAEARSDLVGYDYTRGESVEIPAEWREWLEPSEVAV